MSARADFKKMEVGKNFRHRVTRTVGRTASSEFRPKRAGIEFGCRGDPSARFAIGRLALFLLVERKQLRLISGREILSLCTPPPAEAGVMWRVRLGSRVVGELICRFRLDVDKVFFE
ncbi:hypothetical protein TNCV_4697831 [Trichonephila clavipes]|nr:hypothetical protein TNCV_4697831 [Trichonephila clavipes]